MMKVSLPLAKVRGQLLSNGPVVCVLGVCGLGVFGAGCCALAALQSRETTKTTLQTSATPGLRNLMMKRPGARHFVSRALTVRLDRRQILDLFRGDDTYGRGYGTFGCRELPREHLPESHKKVAKLREHLPKSR